MPGKCLLTGREGRLIATRCPEELAGSYVAHTGCSLPDSLVKKYFTQPINMLECAESGLRWFDPAIIAEKDFYAHLGMTYGWYYGIGWDKRCTLNVLKSVGENRFVDVGCGSGAFIKLAANHALDGVGIDINVEAVMEAQRAGLKVHLESEIPADFDYPPILCMFQTLEHVPDPLAFAQDYIIRTKCRKLIISMPCYESLLGLTSDPLSWPPHHVSFWNEKSIRTLAELTGFQVAGVWRQPLSGYKRFKRIWEREGNRPVPESNLTLSSSPLASYLHFCKSRWKARSWACFEHSILAVLER
jgi:hypothetical protein